MNFHVKIEQISCLLLKKWINFILVILEIRGGVVSRNNGLPVVSLPFCVVRKFANRASALWGRALLQPE